MGIFFILVFFFSADDYLLLYNLIVTLSVSDRNPSLIIFSTEWMCFLLLHQQLYFHLIYLLFPCCIFSSKIWFFFVNYVVFQFTFILIVSYYASFSPNFTLKSFATLIKISSFVSFMLSASFLVIYCNLFLLLNDNKSPDSGT